MSDSSDILVAADALDADAAQAVAAGEPQLRARLLARRKDLAQILRQQQQGIEACSTLDPAVREVVVLTTLRRSRVDVSARRPIALQRGITDDMIEAILDEDWTDPAFDDAQKAAFQFALQYDAGHLINDAVLDAAQAAFDDGELIELAVIAGHYGALARLAVGFRLDRVAG